MKSRLNAAGTIRQKVYITLYVGFLVIFGGLCLLGVIGSARRSGWVPSPLPERYDEAKRLEKEGRYEEALKEYRTAVKINPSLGSYRRLGAVLGKLGDTEGEIESYKKALIYGDPAIYEHLALAEMKLNRYQEAIPHLREAVKRNPRGSSAHMHLALALESTGRMGEALKEYDTALRLDPKNAGAHSNLGVALASIGRIEEAARHFNEALRIEPGHLDAMNNLGIMAARRGELETAIKYFEAALKAHPEDAQTKRNLDKALQQGGTQGKLAAEFEAAQRPALQDLSAGLDARMAPAVGGRPGYE